MYLYTISFFIEGCWNLGIGAHEPFSTFEKMTVYIRNLPKDHWINNTYLLLSVDIKNTAAKYSYIQDMLEESQNHLRKTNVIESLVMEAEGSRYNGKTLNR
jgi:hypothetical protein